MARFTSIFLLLVFLVHVGGYYFISATWREQARASTAQRIENENFSSDETVTFKVPLTVPYGSAYGQFQTVNGEFEHQGEFYKLVKQKLQNDTLYVVAIKDVNEKMVVHYMADFVKASSDNSSSSSGIKLLNTFTKDYVSGISVSILSNDGWSYDLAFANGHARPISQLQVVLSPPPDQLI